MAVRREERYITALMFSYIFGVLTFYYILDPLRKGLFLKNFPSSQLPYAYFLTAFFAGIIATITFKLGQRFSAIRLITGTNVAVIGTLFYFRWAMGREIWYLPWVYFIYVKIVSVLCTTQFWLLAGYIYDNRQAKRIYSVLGTGAAVGALAGSFIPAFLSEHLSTATMIMICIAVCMGLVVVSQIAWRHRRPDAEVEVSGPEEPEHTFSDLWNMIFSSRHLRLMAALIFLTLIASQITDWQVDTAVRAAYAGLPTEEMGRSISQFSARLAFITNVLSIVVQVFLAGFVVRRLGILATIVFLPFALFLTSTAVFIFPSLIAAALARGSDTVSRYSINRSGLELLYLPLPTSVRKRLKIFVDVFVDRTGRAVAGVVIILFTSSALPLGLRGTAAFAMVLTFLCVMVCVQLRKTYVSSFREQLKRREVDLSDVSGYLSDPMSVRFLIEALDSQNERQILYALRLLQSVRNVDFSHAVIRLLDHSSAHVREEAARSLSALKADCTSEAERLLADQSPGVRDAAVDYLCARGRLGRLQSLLADTRMDVRASAARWIADQTTVPFVATSSLVDSLVPTDKVAAASLASRLPGSEAKEYLRGFLQDPSPAVAQAAAVAAARAGQLELVFPVVEMLGSHKLRSGARQALLLYGEAILGTLGDVLRDPSRDIAVRREIAWVLARTPVKRSAELLVENLNTDDSSFEYRIVKALNRLHETKPDLLKSRIVVADKVYAQSRAYYERLALCLAVETAGSTKSLLARALRERMKEDLEILFRLLALDYPRKEIYFAFSALESNRVDLRTSAIEFLDNVLSQKMKSVLLPLLEESSSEALMSRADELFGIKPVKRDEALRLLISRPDSWLRACAEYEMAIG